MIPLVSSVSSARNKYLKKLGNDTFGELFALDPTPNKKYLEWMCRTFLKYYSYSTPSSEIVLPWDVEQRFKGVVNDLVFLDQSQLLKGFDINSYQGSLSDLEEYLSSRSDEILKRRLGLHKLEEGKDYDLVFESDNWLVFRIHTYLASRTLGSGTPWCVVATQDYWRDYTNQGRYVFFYVINKKKPDWKYAIKTDTKKGMEEGNTLKMMFFTDSNNKNIPGTEFKYKTGINPSVISKFSMENFTIVASLFGGIR